MQTTILVRGDLDNKQLQAIISEINLTGVVLNIDLKVTTLTEEKPKKRNNG